MARRLGYLPATTVAEIRASLAAKSVETPKGCRLWTAATSLSGRRKVHYPALKIAGVVWRVNRLVLLLDELDPTLPLPQALARANAARAGDEAAHDCDTALCVARTCLAWKSHRANLSEQWDRQRAQQQAQQHPEDGIDPEDRTEAYAVAGALTADRQRRQGAWA